MSMTALLALLVIAAYLQRGHRRDESLRNGPGHRIMHSTLN